jgi:hypothetical protein
MKMPAKVLVVDGAGVEQTKLILMPCVTHGAHVVLGGGAPGATVGALHLHVHEAAELVDVLRAGLSWAGLQHVAGEPAGDLQGSAIVRGGMYGVSVLNGRYVLSWKCSSFPGLGLVFVDDVGRERAVNALLELLHGKAAAA